MGGNALKTIKTTRLDADRYQALAHRVLAVLLAAWPEAKPHLVRSYEMKPDFGDMDIIIDAAGRPGDVESSLRTLFGCTEIVKNGSGQSAIWSCDVDNFQLDIICMPSEDYATAVDYFAYNDLGNLMGRVSRRLGFKYGHRGLSYQLREGNYLVADIVVSRDMPQIFEFLGYVEPQYDYARFDRGFRNLEGVFNFVASSRYFDCTAYALESRNHSARLRDRKRATYRAFLHWLEEGRVSSGKEAGLPGSHHLSRAELHFPGFAADLALAHSAHEAAKRRRQLFNGEVVSSLTGLSGKPLGALMSSIRNGFSDGVEAFENWLDQPATPEAVARYVLDVFEAQKSGRIDQKWTTKVIEYGPYIPTLSRLLEEGHFD